jgi:hypothetical protein
MKIVHWLISYFEGATALRHADEHVRKVGSEHILFLVANSTVGFSVLIISVPTVALCSPDKF